MLHGYMMILSPGATQACPQSLLLRDVGPRVELRYEMGTTVAQNFGVDLWAHFLPSFSVPVGLGR